MTRNKGEHLNRDETKIAIIEYILNNNKENNDPGISEPKIREHLKGKYGIKDTANIKRQLKGLNESKNGSCLEKFPYKKAGESNYWDITKIKHVENIRDQFPEIQLNTYGKSVNIVLKKFNFPKDSTRAKKAFVQISLSVSFFDKLSNTDIETLYTRAPSLYHLEDVINIKKHIDELIHYVYIETIKRIKTIPYIWPISDCNYIKNATVSDTYQNFPQDDLDSVISEEKFKKMLEDIKLSWEEKGYKKRIRIIIKKLSKELSHKIITGRLIGIYGDPRQNWELLNKISVEIFKKLMGKIPVNLPSKIYSIIYDQYRYTSLIFEKIFEHFYDRDMMDGNDTYLEREFISQVKRINSTKIESPEEMEVINGKLDKLYNEYCEKDSNATEIMHKILPKVKKIYSIKTDNEEQIKSRNKKLVKLYNKYYEKTGNGAEIILEFISKVNDIYLIKIEDPEKMEAKIEKLDQLYNEYYEKCLGRHKISII